MSGSVSRVRADKWKPERYKDDIEALISTIVPIVKEGNRVQRFPSIGTPGTLACSLVFGACSGAVSVACSGITVANELGMLSLNGGYWGKSPPRRLKFGAASEERKPAEVLMFNERRRTPLLLRLLRKSIRRLFDYDADSRARHVFRWGAKEIELFHWKHGV